MTLTTFEKTSSQTANTRDKGNAEKETALLLLLLLSGRGGGDDRRMMMVVVVISGWKRHSVHAHTARSTPPSNAPDSVKVFRRLEQISKGTDELSTENGGRVFRAYRLIVAGP